MYKQNSEYLLNVSSVYKNDSSNSNRTIECYLMHKYLEKSKTPLKTLDIFNKSNILSVCRWCMVTWRSGMYSVYIKPEKRRGKSIRYLCNKTSDLNKYQNKLVHKCLKNDKVNYLVNSTCDQLGKNELSQFAFLQDYSIRSLVLIISHLFIGLTIVGSLAVVHCSEPMWLWKVILCHVCHKKIKVPLHKPNRITDEGDNSNVEEQSNLQSPMKLQKKKKRKKDLTAGLNPDVIAKLHTNSSNVKREENNSNFHGPKLSNKSTKGDSTVIKNLPTKVNTNIIKQNKLKIKHLLDSNKSSAAASNKKKKASLLSAFLDKL